MSIKLLQLTLISICLLTLTSCSLNHITQRLTSNYLKHKIVILNGEVDLVKVRQQLPQDISSLEQLIAEDIENKELHVYAAQAYYSYAFAFIEDDNTEQAISLYLKSHQHAKSALSLHGISDSDLQGSSKNLNIKIRTLGLDAVDALYWTALSWAKMIEISQPNILLFVQLHKTAILMKQVQKLDDTYHNFGSYVFFAVYYAGRPLYLGGNDLLAQKYFKRARSLNHSRLLIIDFLQAKYLNGRIKKDNYTQQLKKIIAAPDNIYPEQALMNAVAKQKALNLLSAGQS